jgi:DHA2 family multidrug resistance protein
LGEHISIYNTLMNTPEAFALLNAEVTRQATMLAYIYDFHLIMLAAMAVLPLIFFIKKITAPSTPHGGLE